MWAVVFFLLAPSRVATPTQFEPPGVTVVVVDVACTPLPGVRVTLRPVEPGPTSRSVRTGQTDSRGRVTVGPGEYGSYLVQAELTGFVPGSVGPITVTPEMRAGVTILMNLSFSHSRLAGEPVSSTPGPR